MMRLTRWIRSYSILIFLSEGLGILSTGGCGGSRIDTLLAESGQGAVYLERAPDNEVSADHPITISSETLRFLLRGIATQEEPNLIQNMVGRKPAPVRVFTDGEVEFLAGPLSIGLQQAAPDQYVGYRLGPPQLQRDTRMGTIYAYSNSLYLNLPWIQLETRYGQGGQAATKALVFSPAQARRSATSPGDQISATTLIIDFQLAASLENNAFTSPAGNAAPPVAPPVSSPSTSQGKEEEAATRLRSLQIQLDEKTAELEALKKALDDLQTQLAAPRDKPGRTK